MNRLDRAFIKAMTMDGYPDPFFREYLPMIIKCTKPEVKVEKIKQIRKLWDDCERREQILTEALIRNKCA